MGNCSNNKKNYGEQTEQCDLGVTRSAIHNGPILNIQSFREDGLLTCGDDKKIAIVDYPSLRSDLNYQPRYLEGHTKAVSRLAVLDEERFVSASRDLSLRQWHVSSGHCTVLPDAHTLTISAVCTSSSSGSAQRLYSGSRDYTVKEWDLSTQTCLQTVSCPRNIVTCLAAQEQLVYQGSEDLCVRAWDFRSPDQPVVFGGYVYFPVSLALQGHHMVTGCKGFNGIGCSVVLWDIRQTLKPLHEFSGHTQDVTSCLFRGNRILSASKDGSVIAWDSQQLSTVQTHTLSRKAISGICAVGKDRIAVAAMDGSITVLREEGLEVEYSTDGCDGTEASG